MRSFKTWRSFKIGDFDQLIDLYEKYRIFQSFNLSRGHLSIPLYRGRQHTPVERLKDLKDLNYTLIHQRLNLFHPPLKDLEVFERLAGPISAYQNSPNRTPLGSGVDAVLARMSSSPRPLEPRGGQHVYIHRTDTA